MSVVNNNNVADHIDDFVGAGGRVDMFNVSQEHCNAGIFIKHVLADSPAGRNGTLKKGDRILEVSLMQWLPNFAAFQAGMVH